MSLSDIFVTKWLKRGELHDPKEQYANLSITAVTVLLGLLAERKIGYPTLAVLLFLVSEEREDRVVVTAVSYIKNALNCATNTAHTALKELINYGFVEKVRGGYALKHQHSSLYPHISIPAIRSERSRRCSISKERMDDYSSISKGRIKKGKTISVEGMENTVPSQYEEGIKSEERRKKEGSLSLASQAEAGAEAVPASPSTPHLQIVSPEGIPVQRYYTEKYLSEVLAKMEINAHHETVRNPTIRKRYYLEDKIPEGFDIPELGDKSFLPGRKMVLMMATNAMCVAQVERKVPVVIVPANYAQAAVLSDSVSSFSLHGEGWETKFYRFFSWVLDNKPNWSFNFLSSYLGDYAGARYHNIVGY